ncbi:MAG: undecaprenyl diphosphate synthase family protein [Ilumatobacteraceae bacterium]
MASPGDDRTLRHVLVVGGTVAEWGTRTDSAWASMLTAFGEVANGAGAQWLTLRPLDAPGDDETSAPDTGASPVATRRQVVVGGCEVLADPAVDGRDRFVRAVEQLRVAGARIDESSLDRVLDAPAEANPDLAVVLGPAHRWPRSLMWELAYSELVYLDVPWSALQPAHLADAIAAYAHRHRRFGGVD